MWPNPQFPADLALFTREILNGKLHFLCNESYIQMIRVVLVLLTLVNIFRFANVNGLVECIF